MNGAYPRFSGLPSRTSGDGTSCAGYGKVRPPPRRRGPTPRPSQQGGSFMAKAVIVSAARTAVGTLGGALAQQPATKLGAIAVREAIQRAKLTPEQVDEVILGHVLPAGLGLNPARVAALEAGLPKEKTAFARQQGVRLGAQGGRPGGAVRHAGRRRHHRGGRHGEHERSAVHLEEGAFRDPHGARAAPRLDDRRRPHLPDHPRPHGHHGRERRRQVRHLPRGAGRVRGGEPAEGGRGHRGRPVQGRDRARRGAGGEEGRDLQVRGR